MGVTVWWETDLSPSLPMWVTWEEVEVDYREELYTLHVLNLFIEGQLHVEGKGRKCALRPKWNTSWREVGRRPLKMTPGLCAGTASAIDPARDGREGSQVPPEGLRTRQFYYEWVGQRTQFGLRPAAPGYITVKTTRVNWLHPNKRANTDDSLVDKKLNRHILPIKTLGRTSIAECFKNSIKHSITPNEFCERIYILSWYVW